MSLHSPQSRPRSYRPAILIALLVLGLLAALSDPASASPKVHKLTAITAMPSKLSSLRRDAQGKQMTQAERNAELKAMDSAPTLGSSDQMGTPADKTVVESDQVFRETNTSGTAGSAGNTTTASAYGLKDDMSAIDGTPTESPLTQRAVIDHQYPSSGGHFLDSTHMGVLDFKEQVAGSDGLFTLASPNQSVESWAVATTGSQLAAGTTYEITQAGVALTNSAIAKSEALHTQATSTKIAAGSPDPSQLWAMVDSGHGDGTFSLVNRSDGLCLARDGEEVTIDSCIDDPSRHWNQSYDSGSHQVQIFPVASDAKSSLGSDGGQGVADTLGANTSQTWTALALNEPGGSVPSWSTVRTNGYTTGNVAAPADMAVGDLDGIPTKDADASALSYHDEAAVAWVDGDDDLQIRVIDYNANASHLLVTAPSDGSLLGKKVGTSATQGPLGDVLVGVGDFNGDGRNEIVTAYQDSDSDFVFAFWSYVANADGSRTLKPASCTGCQGAKPFADTANISNETGYADLAVGDFDGDGSDDIAVGFATYDSATDTTDHDANLGVWTLGKAGVQGVNGDAGLTTRSVEVTSMPTDHGTLPRTLDSDDTRTQSGIRLVSGYFLANPAAGFGPQRSELAIGYDEYTVGAKEWNTWNEHYVHSYVVEPVVNIYQVTTSNCNVNDTTCTTDTEPTNTATEPTPLFPSHKTQTAYRTVGDHLDAAPLSLAAGGFAGTADTDPPVDGLLASTWLEWNDPNVSGYNPTYYSQQSITVPWVAKDTTFQKWTTNDWQQQVGPSGVDNNNPVLTRYTAYDRRGDSIVLGAPVLLHIEGQDHDQLVAAQPPKQVDWLNGGWSNVSATPDLYLQAGSTSTKTVSTSTSQQNTWSQAVSEGSDIKLSWNTDDFVSQEKGSLDLNQKFDKTWSGLSENSTDASSTWTTNEVVQANGDDDYSYSSDDTMLYRYPVIGGPGQYTATSGTCQQGCRSYYDVAVPLGSVPHDNVPGQATDTFQPSWENNNALSYPAVNANGTAPIPDLGDYSYTDSGGQEVVSAPLYNERKYLSDNPGTVSLDFSQSKGSGSTLTSSRNWDASVTATAHANVSLGSWATVGAFGADLDLTASLGYDTSKGSISNTMGSNQTTTDTSFAIVQPSIPSNESYGIASAYYYASDGAAKVVHAVDLTSDQQGKGWWATNYGAAPDPALNLPGRIDFAYDPTTQKSDTPVWVISEQRQLLRQFQVLQTADDGSGLDTKGDPYTSNPTAGQSVIFQVPVHNYSLAAMTASTTATWYAVPVDVNNLDVTGSAVKIGTTTVPALGAQGVTTIASPAWTAADTAANNAMQQYRIFVRLDEAGTAADLHPLSGTACPVSTLQSTGNNTTPALYDLMKAGTVADPLGCGQDNQGYGLVTVDPTSSTTGVGGVRLATAASPARAQLSGGGVVDEDPGHLSLTETSDVPTVAANAPVTLLVHASSDLLTDSQPEVDVFDGPVSDGKLIAIRHLAGISPNGGGTVSFSWTPTTPGVHELHEVLLGRSVTGQDDEQIMRVNVAQPLEQYTVKAAASPSSVPIGGAFSVTGTISPVPDTAYDRTVQLQQKVGTDWKVIDNQQTSSNGKFDFDLTGTKAGSSTYRVWKLATTGRAAAVSGPITVVVGAFAVTAKASPSSIKLGKRSTISGKVTPTVPTASDRKIELQLKSGSTWKKVSTATTAASGSYAISVKPTKTGTLRYRVVKLAAAGLRTAHSPVLIVKVARR